MNALPVPVATEVELEFDRQVDALAQTGMPERLDLRDSCFRALLEPLRDLLPPPEPDTGTVPFVVVLPDLPVRAVLDQVPGVGGTGFTTMDDEDLARFQPLPELGVPPVPYLLLDVDTGPDTFNRPPGELAPALAAG